MSDLAPLVTLVRRYAEAALLRRLNAGSGFADPRVPSQIYLRDESALARIAGGTLRPQRSHEKAAEDLAREIRDHKTATHGGNRFTTMVARLDLDASHTGLVLVAVAYALDLDTRELCHALAPRRRAALYVETIADVLQSDPAVLLRATAPGSPLRRGRAVAVAADGDGLAATIDIPNATLSWLLGEDAIQPPLASACTLLAPDAELGVVLPPAALAALDALVPRLQDKGAPACAAIVVRGPRGSGRRAAAHRLARTLGRPLFVIDTPALVALESRARVALFASALAAARIRDAVPFLADAEALYDERGDMVAEHQDALAAMPGVVLASTAKSGHLELQRPALQMQLPRTELDDRDKAWSAALQPYELQQIAAELAGRYVIGPGAIADVVSEAARYAKAAARSLDPEALEASVGRRLSLRLGTFGTVVQRKARFAEMVLPDEVVDTLHDMLAMVRERSQILERWGYQRHLGISRGVSGLFSGEPGTGKTMAASVMASELGLELVRIDLSTVVSKYVGETEKNLGKIFDEAQDAHAMLLFDEADSLFGKRTELKTAQDRFANLEVNYILQRMETFDGVSVLTTNAESSIDPALQRRLNFRIRFPEPEVEEREKLWKQLLPPQAGLHDGIDFATLAERFDMTGGYIKNAVVRAAVIAARAGRAMVAEDLWTGAHHEYVEMGKVMPQLPRK
ncbi:MAG: ATP-binding protein [Myxococcota bacterium]|nr:ATP-binding protein [Myxococcota bacterium]